MSLITSTAPSEATGEVAALYRRLQGRGDYLPNYARIFSHRPGMMAPLNALQEVIRAPLEPRLWALVSLASASASRTSYCALSFANKLIRKHFSEKELYAIVTGTGPDPLSARERAAYDFAALVAAHPARIDEPVIAGLREAGFDDTAIFDLAAAAAWRCFFGRVPESLGAAPDRALGQMPGGLLQALLVGRPLDSAEEESFTQSPPAPEADGDLNSQPEHATSGNSQPPHAQ